MTATWEISFQREVYPGLCCMGFVQMEDEEDLTELLNLVSDDAALVVWEPGGMIVSHL